jgi:branched-chain amino acid transport system substrate-binding protein
LAVGSERRQVALLAAAALLGSCSLSRPDVADCSSNSDCQEAFGPGHVCGDDGLCAIAPSFARCIETLPSDLLKNPTKYKNARVVGSIVDRSVTTQQARGQAVELAAAEANEQGGLDGRTIGVVFCDVAENDDYDTRSRTEAARASASYLVRSLGVAAIVGPSASTDLLEVFNELSGTGTLLVSPSATSPALTGIDTATPTDETPGLLWRTAPPDTVQAAVIAQHLAQLPTPVTELFVIHEDGVYGDALVGTLLPEFQGLGGTATVRVFSSDTERNAAVNEAGASSVEWVLFVSSQTSDASAFLNAADAIAGFDTKMVFLTDSAANSDLLTATQSASTIYPRVVGTKPGLPSGNVYEEFAASYSAAYQDDADKYSFLAHAYDAAWLTFLGMTWAEGQEPGLSGIHIARGLRRIVDTGSPEPLVPTNWPKFRQTMLAGAALNLTGASGSLDFDPDTEETTGPVNIWNISGGQIQVVKTYQP